MVVSAKELRTRLSYYLDQLEKGEEVTIIRNSYVIGTLTPADTIKPYKGEKSKTQSKSHQLKDGLTVTFRQYHPKDREVIKELHEAALKSTGTFVKPDINDPTRDLDLEDIDTHYLNMNGDFIVGELEGEVVAMGGYRLAMVANKPGAAELKRMRVQPRLQGQGIGKKLLILLEDKARDHGYKFMLLDTTDKQLAAQKLYESQGYQEFKRETEGPFNLIYYQKQL